MLIFGGCLISLQDWASLLSKLTHLPVLWELLRKRSVRELSSVYCELLS